MSRPRLHQLWVKRPHGDEHQQPEDFSHSNYYFILTAALSPLGGYGIARCAERKSNQSVDDCKEKSDPRHSLEYGGLGFKPSFWSVDQREFERGPRCHMSSFRLLEMDVLHFSSHNICRGNRSSPQRPWAAVLKLSIVLAGHVCGFLHRDPREGDSRRRAGRLPAPVQGKWVSRLPNKTTESWWGGAEETRDLSRSVSEDDARCSCFLNWFFFSHSAVGFIEFHVWAWILG